MKMHNNDTPSAVKQKLQTRTRRSQGTSIAELAGILLVLFIFFAFPLMNLCALGLRSSLLISSAKEASIRASKSLTYSVAPSGVAGNNVPAIQVAQETVKSYLANFSGVKATSVQVGIITVNNSNGIKSGPVYSALPTTDTTFGNTYYLDVVVTGQAEPLVSYIGGLLGPIPGLTSPIQLVCHGQRVFENPKGLTL